MSAILPLSRIVQLYGATIPMSDIYGVVDGSQATQLVDGDSVVCNLIPYGTTENVVLVPGATAVPVEGNFVCRMGTRNINGTDREILTIGWMTKQGRLLAMGSLKKKNSANELNPLTTGVPNVVEKAEMVKALDGATITVGKTTNIRVAKFRPSPEDKDPTVAGTWTAFTVVVKP
jgi:hypothetical protein